MNDLKTIRSEIDALDATIMGALDARFALMSEVKRIKAQEGLKTTDSARESRVLEKAESFRFTASIQTVYHTIMEASKALQK